MRPFSKLSMNLCNTVKISFIRSYINYINTTRLFYHYIYICIGNNNSFPVYCTFVINFLKYHSYYALTKNIIILTNALNYPLRT